MKHFGSTIAETKAALSKPSINLGTKDEEVWRKNRFEAKSRLLISLLLVLAGFSLVYLNINESQTIGASAISAVIGYWIK